VSTQHPPTIIAGCDGADRGRQAVVLSRTLARLAGARMLIVGVYRHPALPFPPPLGHRDDEYRRTEAAVRSVRDELAPEAHVVVVPGFSPAHGLCQVAEQESAAMIAVGSRHAAERRMGDADDALQVLRSARAAVLVVPDDRPAPGALARIVVGFDGSPTARQAVGVAAQLARAAGGGLTLFSAIGPEVSAWWLDSPSSRDADILEHFRVTRGRELERAADEALRDSPEIGATRVIAQGDPVTRLRAAGADADLLVVGSRQWGALGRLVLGTVSEAVVRESDCATLVVPRGHGAESAVAALSAGLAAHHAAPA
jgi:nucleotide-binding universal stress UspA family protein